MAYATTTALAAEVAARKAADTAEAKTRATAVTQINGRLSALEDRMQIAEVVEEGLSTRLMRLETWAALQLPKLILQGSPGDRKAILSWA